MNFTMYAKFHKRVREHGIEEAADYASSLGFSSVEFIDWAKADWDMLVPDKKTATHFRKVLADRSLSVACYSVVANLYEAGMTPDTVTETERYLMHYVEMAAELGSPFLHHTLLLGQKRTPDLPLETALALILPAVTRVARYAHSLGVTCIYEDQGEYFNGVSDFAAFFRAIKAECPWVGVCGDVGNVLFVDASPAAFFRAFAKDILHAHVKDYVSAREPLSKEGWAASTGGVWLKECVVGEGVVDVPACISILREEGYCGAFALENNHEEDFAEGCKIAMQLVEKHFATVD